MACGLVKISERAIEITVKPIDGPAIDQCAGELWIKFYGDVKVEQRPIGMKTIRPPARIIGGGGLWIEPDGLIDIGEGRTNLVARVICGAWSSLNA
jgi:hypothetical protein